MRYEETYLGFARSEAEKMIENMKNMFELTSQAEFSSEIKPNGDLVLSLKFDCSRSQFLRAIFSEVLAQHIGLEGLEKSIGSFQDIMNVYISFGNDWKCPPETDTDVYIPSGKEWKKDPESD